MNYLLDYNPKYLDTSTLEEGCLKDYQHSGVRWLITPVPGYQRYSRVLADAPGMGKTVQACGFIDHQLATVRGCRVLVCVPAALVAQWAQELARFLPDVPVHVAKAGSFETATEPIILISRELTTRRAEALARCGFTAAVVDELAAAGQVSIASKYTPMKCVRPPGLTALRSVLKAVSGPVVGLSGTLVENDAVAPHGFFDAINLPGLPPWAEWLKQIEYNDGMTYAQVNVRQDIPPKPTGVTPTGVGLMRSYLGIDKEHDDPSRLVLIRRPEEVGLSLPTKVEPIEPVFVPLTYGQQAAYAEAERRDEGGIRGHHEKQMASRMHEKESALLDRAIQLINTEYAGQKAILYAENLAVLDQAEERLKQQGQVVSRIDGSVKDTARTKQIEQHRQVNGPAVMLGNAVLQRGLNLQYANVMISCDTTYNPEAERQREGRMRRLGSPHATYTHVVLLPDVQHGYNKAAVLDRKRSTAALLGLD